MTREQLADRVESLPGYQPWLDQSAQLAAGPAPMIRYISGIRETESGAQQEYDFVSTLIDTTQRFMAEVATYRKIDLPQRLGMLAALHRFITSPVQDRRGLHVLDDDTVSAISGDALDPITDSVHAAHDPITYASQIGDAITKVEEQLPRLTPIVPAMVISMEWDGPESSALPVTHFKMYSVLPPRARKSICREPLVLLDRDKKPRGAEYELPTLQGIRARYIANRQKIRPIKGALPEIVQLPELEMLTSYDDIVLPRKLLIGRSAVEQAEISKVDLTARSAFV